MNLAPFKPEPGFRGHYWRVLRKAAAPMLGTVFTVEAAFSVVYFFGPLVSKNSGEAISLFLARHPYVAIAPALLAAAWVFLVVAHRQHESDLRETEPKPRPKTRAEVLLGRADKLLSASSISRDFAPHWNACLTLLHDVEVECPALTPLAREAAAALGRYPCHPSHCNEHIRPVRDAIYRLSAESRHGAPVVSANLIVRKVQEGLRARANTFGDWAAADYGHNNGTLWKEVPSTVNEVHDFLRRTLGEDAVEDFTRHTKPQALNDFRVSPHPYNSEELLPFCPAAVQWLTAQADSLTEGDLLGAKRGAR